MHFYFSRVLRKFGLDVSQLIPLQGKHIQINGICFMSLSVSEAAGKRNSLHTHLKQCSLELSDRALIKANNPFTWVANGSFIYTWIHSNFFFFSQTFNNSSVCCYNYEKN